MKRTLNRGLLLTGAILLLTACAKPVPPEKAAYVGEWRGPDMTLIITEDGYVDYERRNGGVNTSIDAPIKTFAGDDFEVGIGLLTTTFDVSQPPYDDNGTWKMVVDGVELSRLR